MWVNPSISQKFHQNQPHSTLTHYSACIVIISAIHRKPGTCQPRVWPQALPLLPLPQGLWLPFLVLISDTAQLWDLGQSCRRKSLLGVSHLTSPEMLTLYPCCNFLLFRSWPTDVLFCVDSGPGPSVGTYLWS